MGRGGGATAPLTIAALAGLASWPSGLTGCQSDGDAGLQASHPVAAVAEAVDRNTVAVVFTETLVASSVDRSRVEIFAPYDGAAAALGVRDVAADGGRLVIGTDDQIGGRLYSVRLGPLQFDGVDSPDAPSQINFNGYGTAPVTVRLNTAGRVVPGALVAMATVDPTSGAFDQQFNPYPLTDADDDGVFEATVDVRLDDAQVYAVRAVDDAGRPAGSLVSFSVSATDGAMVELEALLPELPEFDPPVDPTPGDGAAPVRIIFDDRYARVLTRPALRLSVDAAGMFDLSTQRVDTAQPVAGKPRVYEIVVTVAVDPNRVPDGVDAATFPYVAFLVEAGEDIPQRGTTFVMPEERPQVIVIPIGNPALVPVTFRIDAGTAVLEPDLGLRGVYPGEGLFLTGEFPAAEDALGRLAADAFSGGERATLEMNERQDAPGIYEKTVFMQPNRPYGWKVVRCQTGAGCSELNRHVTSSGRAFPTVMKNLVTAADDAANNPSVVVVDPAALDSVTLAGGTVADYSNATVSSDGSEAPSTAVLFKQEVPDMVVNVSTERVVTPTYVVGTWRDVNITSRPSEIIASGDNIDLADTDYDDGLIGAPPIIRQTPLPDDPGLPMQVPGRPAFDASDGIVDAAATSLPNGGGRLPLSVSWNERVLYVATAPAAPGVDHFVFVSLVEPTTAAPAQWAKGGQAASSAQMAFLAMEGDGNFSGWFRRSAAGTDTPLDGVGAVNGAGSVIEGSLDLAALGFTAGDAIWVGAVAYGTNDGDPLVATSQHPSGNGDFDLDPAELARVELAAVRAP